MILAGLLLVVLSGCSIHPFRTVTVKGQNLASDRDIPFIDPNDTQGPYKIIITKTEDGDTFYKWSADMDLAQEKPSRLKYNWLRSFFPNLTVNGKLDGRNYPVTFDTGASPGAMLLNTIHVRRHKLPYLPMNTNETSFLGGFCFAPELRIGNINVSNYPAMYAQKHGQLRLFGVPAGDDDSIIVGLPLMRHFKYFLLDGRKKEVEISVERVFEIEPGARYQSYPLIFEEHAGNNVQLFVTIPVAGEEMTLQLDTGSDGGLDVTESGWKRLRERITPVKLKEGSTHYPFYGRYECREAVMKDLLFGERTLRKTTIQVFADGERPVGDARDGLIGLELFENTEIVLDFERDILWVRNGDSD